MALTLKEKMVLRMIRGGLPEHKIHEYTRVSVGHIEKLKEKYVNAVVSEYSPEEEAAEIERRLYGTSEILRTIYELNQKKLSILRDYIEGLCNDNLIEELERKQQSQEAKDKQKLKEDMAREIQSMKDALEITGELNPKKLLLIRDYIKELNKG